MRTASAIFCLWAVFLFLGAVPSYGDDRFSRTVPGETPVPGAAGDFALRLRSARAAFDVSGFVPVDRPGASWAGVNKNGNTEVRVFVIPGSGMPRDLADRLERGVARVIQDESVTIRALSPTRLSQSAADLGYEAEFSVRADVAPGLASGHARMIGARGHGLALVIVFERTATLSSSGSAALEAFRFTEPPARYKAGPWITSISKQAATK